MNLCHANSTVNYWVRLRLCDRYGVDRQINDPLAAMIHESDTFFEDYKYNKGLELTRRSEARGAIAEDALRKMLERDEQIVIALYHGADAGERELIKNSYIKTLERFK